MLWKHILNSCPFTWKWILMHIFFQYSYHKVQLSDPGKKKFFHVVPGPVQEVLPVRSQDLVPVPENIRDLVGRNQGEWGSISLQSREKKVFKGCRRCCCFFFSYFASTCQFYFSIWKLMHLPWLNFLTMRCFHCLQCAKTFPWLN